jgi:LAS superfamily LD-carboxypeptidase LdcB
MLPVKLGDTWEKGVKLGTSVLLHVLGVWMTIGTAIAALRMFHAAAQDGVFLTADSGWRSFDEQAALYTAYLAGKGLGIAAKPGSSNHQSGVAIDIAVQNSTTSRAYLWLKANAQRFGFIRTVSSEPWHWEYRPGSAPASYT